MRYSIYLIMSFIFLSCHPKIPDNSSINPESVSKGSDSVDDIKDSVTESQSDSHFDSDLNSEPESVEDIGTGIDDTSPSGGTTGGNDYRDVTLLAPQSFILVSNAVAGEVVGNVDLNYRIFHSSGSLNLEIIANTPNNNFSINSSGSLILNTLQGLSPGQNYSITLRARDQSKLIQDQESFQVQVVNSSNVIFIDPTYSGTETGTRTQPYNTWQEAWNVMSSGRYLLQRRGTVASLASFNFNKASLQNVTIGAYGNGLRPTMSFTSGGVNISGRSGITIRDLKLVSPNSSSAVIMIPPGSHNTTVRNCEISGGNVGVNMQGSMNLKVYNSEIHHNMEDGIYTTSEAGVQVSMEIAFNYVHHVNQNFQGTYVPDNIAPGDSMQLNGLISNLNVHHNIMDRSDTGNKFCLITSPRDHSSVISLNYNYCIANNSVTALTDDPVSGIYMENILISGGNTNPLEIIGNKFENVNIGVLIRDFLSINMHFNQINNVSTGISLGANTRGNFYHNLIRNASYSAIGLGSSPASFRFKNNIYAINSPVPIYRTGVNNIIESDYNIFTHQASNFISGYGNLSSWQSTGNDTHSLLGLPNFQNVSQLDFHLTPMSIGLGDGVAGLGNFTDIESQPLAEPPHIGPYQFAFE